MTVCDMCRRNTEAASTRRYLMALWDEDAPGNDREWDFELCRDCFGELKARLQWAVKAALDPHPQEATPDASL